MKKQLLTLLLVLGMVGWLSACSSSPSEEEDAASAEEMTDAGTDALPPDNAELANPNPEQTQTGDQVLDSLPAEQAQPPAPPVEPMHTESASTGGEMMDYTVQKGDTLMQIAFETLGDLNQWRSIYEGNQSAIQNPNRLVAGTALKIPRPSSPVVIDRNGEKYLIKTGDTLGTISSDVYGTPKKWKRIYENNRQLIRDPNKIYAGFYLYYQFTEQDQQEKEQGGQPQTLGKTGSPPAAPVEPQSPGLLESAPPAAPRAPGSAQ